MIPYDIIIEDVELEEGFELQKQKMYTLEGNVKEEPISFKARYICEIKGKHYFRPISCDKMHLLEGEQDLGTPNIKGVDTNE